MTVEGTFTNGVVVLDDSRGLPEGTRVQVVVPATRPEPADQPRGPTLRGLLQFAGAVDDLPADMADQHDHYIHGTPRR
jgi:hypothetical protein